MSLALILKNSSIELWIDLGKQSILAERSADFIPVQDVSRRESMRRMFAGVQTSGTKSE